MSLRNARSKQACFQGENREPGITVAGCTLNRLRTGLRWARSTEADGEGDVREPCDTKSGQGSNAGHSSGVAQGQRSLNRCSGRDFQHEVFAPTATAAFHSQTVAAGMLLQQRPTRRVLSCATAKLLRDEAESMVPNIDPEQVRKLAGWGLTQNDRASFVGWSQSLLSLRF